MAALASLGAAHAQKCNPPSSARSAIDLANPLVGTAPLDQPALIGNAPPPGELLYSRLTSPGARLPQSRTEAAPVNVNVDLGYPMGVDASYAYANPTMIGFTGGGSADGAQAAPIIMPVVGDWTVPPSHTQSYYGKASEKASPGVIRYSNA